MSSGDTQNSTPQALGVNTLTDVLALPNLVELTGAFLDTISTDDSSRVVLDQFHDSSETARSSLLLKYRVTDAEEAIIQFREEVRYQHYNQGKNGNFNDLNYTYKLYIWNHVSGAFDLLTTHTGTGVVELMPGHSENLPNYITPSLDVYLLLWDYSGSYATETGGGSGPPDPTME